MFPDRALTRDGRWTMGRPGIVVALSMCMDSIDIDVAVVAAVPAVDCITAIWQFGVANVCLPTESRQAGRVRCRNTRSRNESARTSNLGYDTSGSASSGTGAPSRPSRTSTSPSALVANNPNHILLAVALLAHAQPKTPSRSLLAALTAPGLVALRSSTALTRSSSSRHSLLRTRPSLHAEPAITCSRPSSILPHSTRCHL